MKDEADRERGGCEGEQEADVICQVVELLTRPTLIVRLWQSPEETSIVSLMSL